jgi:cation transport ATPase
MSEASQEVNGLNGVIESLPVKMEIDGHPYYIKSKGNVPYIYDIDTNNEVGYWSSKRGGYVMFSLYNQIMKQKYDNNAENAESNEEKEEDKENGNVVLSDSESDESDEDDEESDEDDEESEDDEEESEDDDEDEEEEESEDEDEEEEESEDEDEEEEEDEEEDEEKEERLEQMSTYSLMFAFIMFFVYLTLQREFQTIYFDFMFLILINLLNTLKVFEILEF